MNPSQNAKYALVMAENKEPIVATNQNGEWIRFLSTIANKRESDQPLERIHGSVWLIPLSTGMPFLAVLFSEARAGSIPLRILFLDEKPDWIKYPPDVAAKA
jgi:hypothetical protein